MTKSMLESLADAEPDTSAPPQFNAWTCVDSPDALFDLAFEQGGVRLNNISLAVESDYLFTRQPVVRLSAAAANRSTGRASISLELYGAHITGPNEAEVVLAISTGDLWGGVPPGSSEELVDTVYTAQAHLELDQICVRAFLGLGS